MPPFEFPYVYGTPVANDMNNHDHLQYDPYHGYTSHPHPVQDRDEQPATSSIPVGTYLHKGFYDLLAMIPTPSPSRFLWGNPAPSTADSVVAGPRYEDISPPANAAIKAMPRKGRRVSKDMVSKPTGFV